MKIPLSWFDLTVLVTIGIFVIRNAWIGFLRGLSSLLGLIVGYLLASKFSSTIEGILSPWVKTNWLHVISFAMAFLIGFLAVFIVVELLARALKSLRLGWLDHFLGAGLGFLKGALVVTFFFMLIVTFYPQSKDLFRDSFTYPYLASSARFLAQIFPARWKSKFNYNLRHYLDLRHGQKV